VLSHRKIERKDQTTTQYNIIELYQNYTMMQQ